MISITMQLGIAPIPETKSRSRVHTADGKPARAVNKRTDRAESIVERRNAIIAICKHEPTTIAEIKEATGIKDGTLADDIRKMLDESMLRRRLHRAEALYWVPA